MKYVLKIENCSFSGGGGKDRKKAIGELCIDDGLNEFAERFGVEFMARELPLELPIFAVYVEDAVTEKIRENSGAEMAFLVVVEIGLEDVLDDFGVCCDDLTLTKGATKDEGGRGLVIENVRHPVVEAVSVFDDREIRTEDWVGSGESSGFRREEICEGGLNVGDEEEGE